MTEQEAARRDAARVAMSVERCLPVSIKGAARQWLFASVMHEIAEYCRRRGIRSLADDEVAILVHGLLNVHGEIVHESFPARVSTELQ